MALSYRLQSYFVVTTCSDCSICTVCATCVTCLALLPCEPFWAVTCYQVHTLSASPTIPTNINPTGLEFWRDQLIRCK